MSLRRVTVFGGTGFLGRRIVRHLQDADFAVWIASRHPDRRRSLFSGDVSGIDTFRADVNDDGSVASADSNSRSYSEDGVHMGYRARGSRFRAHSVRRVHLAGHRRIVRNTVASITSGSAQAAHQDRYIILRRLLR